MDGQNITLVIDGEEYPYVASSPEEESLMREAARMVSENIRVTRMKYPKQPMEDILRIEAFKATLRLLHAKSVGGQLLEEVSSLESTLSEYLDKESNR